MTTTSEKICIRLIPVLFVISTVVACQSDHSGTSSELKYTSSIAESLNTFSAEGKELDAHTVSTDAQQKMLGCELPSTSQRLEGDNLTVNYKVVSRDRRSVDSHFGVRDEDRGYSTNSGGAIYRLTYTLNRLSIDELSALPKGPISYRDACTTSGCDIKQREYLAGSARYLAEVDAHARKIAQDAELKPRKKCSFTSTGPRASTVRQGRFPLSGVDYRAVRVTTSEDGELYCEANIGDDRAGSLVYVGKAKRAGVLIALGDSLPKINEDFSGFSVAPTRLGVASDCARTVVFASEYVESDGTVYEGKSKEIVFASVGGKILSVDEYNSRRKERATLIKRLGDDVILARAQQRDAEVASAQAFSSAKEARATADRLEREASQLEASARMSSATESERAKAVQARGEASSASAHAARLESVAESKKEVLSLASKRLLESESNLTRAEQDETKARAN